MRIENRMQLQLWREECKQKAAERKLLYSRSVEEQDVWQVVRIKSMPV